MEEGASGVGEMRAEADGDWVFGHGDGNKHSKVFT